MVEEQNVRGNQSHAKPSCELQQWPNQRRESQFINGRNKGGNPIQPYTHPFSSSVSQQHMGFFGFSGSSLYSSSNASSSSSIDFWFQNERMNFGYVWATPVALLVILIFHFSKRFFSFPPPPPPKQHLVSSSPAPTATDIGFSNDRISEIVSEADLKFLIEVLDEKLTEKGE
ncbi:hypothetical protein OIU74_004576 [Salix koriyanagi]|uniref:Transmembrane protein n=1 Tax=Salix koriyanagi TaxID=2511006 RepID=A0A9Q0UMS2_9ROSI|nr:hypothetical protein OIU74_004576 [Salix koriyanagi]